VHLIPPERTHRRVIDGHRVCAAIEALGEPPTVATWAQRFALLGDPGRLSLMLCVWRAGPISVSDLAVATNMNDTAVSQALRLLRANGLVSADRDGRIIRYRLSEPSAADVLAQVAPGPLTGDSVPIVDAGG
jgi:DNA-binding transcriptional ArsR family regulator